MTSIVEYITEEKLPTDKKEAGMIKRQAPTFVMVNGILYKRGYTLPYLRCVSPEACVKLHKEAHGGFCRDHSNGVNLVKKVMRQGLYRAQMTSQAIDYVRRCGKYWKFSKILCLPPSELTSISIPWPFNALGIDLIRPLLVSKREVKYAVVAIDYFTKWVAAESFQITRQEKFSNL